MFEHEKKYHAGAVSPPGYAGYDVGQAEMGPPQSSFYLPQTQVDLPEENATRGQTTTGT